MQLTAHRPERSVFIFLSILAFFQKDNVHSERLGNVASCWTRCGSVNLLDRVHYKRTELKWPSPTATVVTDSPWAWESTHHMLNSQKWQMCFFFHPRVERLKGEMKPNVNAALFALKSFLCCSFHILFVLAQTHTGHIVRHQSWRNRLYDTPT